MQAAAVARKAQRRRRSKKPTFTLRSRWKIVNTLLMAVYIGKLYQTNTFADLFFYSPANGQGRMF